jgi:hypothetical protein
MLAHGFNIEQLASVTARGVRAGGKAMASCSLRRAMLAYLNGSDKWNAYPASGARSHSLVKARLVKAGQSLLAKSSKRSPGRNKR